MAPIIMMKRRRRNKRNSSTTALLLNASIVAGLGLWLLVVLRQNDLFEPKQQEQEKILSNYNRTNSSSFPAGGHHHVVTSSSTDDQSKSDDAYFNTVSVRRRQNQSPPATSVRCVGPQNDKTTDWMYRSCKYTNLCFDVATQNYVYFITDENNNDEFTTSLPDIAIGAINPRWGVVRSEDDRGGIDKIRWKPVVQNSSQYDSYYELDEHILLLPFHSMAGHNVGHLLWDDFYSIYKLLQLFGYINNDNLNENISLLLIRQNKLMNHNNATSSSSSLYATCDIRRNKRMQCKANFERFLPLLGVDPATFSTSKTVNFTTGSSSSSSGSSSSSNSLIVCAKTAVAGMGLLQDHGWRDHGWERFHYSNAQQEDLTVPHNLGRGRQFYNFRNFMLTNFKYEEPSLSSSSTLVQWPPQLTFSLRSSSYQSRRLNFTEHQQALREALQVGTATVSVQSYDMRDLSLQEQIRIATSSSIFVTASGGGAMTATFLPKDASLILFYDAAGGMDFDLNQQPNGLPARLDWDLFNNAAHLRVHWLPIQAMNEPENLQLFVRLIQHELAILRRIREDRDNV